MSTVQEAASLFGSGSDEGSDPFVSAVNSSSDPAQDSTPFSPPPTSSTNTAHDSNPSSVQGKVVTSGAQDYKPVDDLFGGAPLDGADDPFGGGEVSGSDWLVTGDVNADATGTQGGYSDYSNQTNTAPPEAFDQSQGWPAYGQVQQQQQQPQPQQQHYQAYGTSEHFLQPP